MVRVSDKDMSAFFIDLLSCVTNSVQNNSFLSEEEKSTSEKAFGYKGKILGEL